MKLWATFSLAFFTTLCPSISLGESLICGKSYQHKPFSYIHPNRGKVVVYTTPANYTPIPEDLTCATIKQFWIHKNSFPDKLAILVVRADYKNALLLQINLRTNTMMIAPIDIPSFKDPPEIVTVWTIFPDPMERLTEMIRLETLPLATKGDVRANYARVSQRMLIDLALPKLYYPK